MLFFRDLYRLRLCPFRHVLRLLVFFMLRRVLKFGVLADVVVWLMSSLAGSAVCVDIGVSSAFALAGPLQTVLLLLPGACTAMTGA